MAELALRPRTGFEGLAVAGRHGVGDHAAAGLVIAERPDLAVAQLAVFHGKTDEVAAAIREIAGIELPNGPKRATANGLSLIGIGPGQYLAVAEGDLAKELLARIAGALVGLAAVVDQSDAKAILRLSGPHARDVLAKGCSVDLHPRVFTTEDAATTLASLVPCQIGLLDDEPTFELAVPLSYARGFWFWLTAAAAEFGYDVVAPAKSRQG
jgi:sarcosine oxidase subunit gamma